MALDNQQTNNLNDSNNSDGLPLNQEPAVADSSLPANEVNAPVETTQQVPSANQASPAMDSAISGYNLTDADVNQSSQGVENNLSNNDALASTQTNTTADSLLANDINSVNETNQALPAENNAPLETSPQPAIDMTEQIMADNSLNVTNNNDSSVVSQTQAPTPSEPVATGDDIEIIPGKLMDGAEPIPAATTSGSELPGIEEINTPPAVPMEAPTVNPIEQQVASSVVDNQAEAAPINTALENNPHATLDQLASTPKAETAQLLDKLLPQSPAMTAPSPTESMVDKSLPPLVEQDEKKMGGKTKMGLVLIILVCVVIGVLLLLIGLALSPSLNLNIPIISDLVSSLGL